jgi:hypothetical protein
MGASTRHAALGAAALLAAVGLAASCGGGSDGTGGQTGTTTSSNTTGGSGGTGGEGFCTKDADCSGGKQCCGAVCVDTQTSFDHCGGCDLSCGNKAHATAVCVAGSCSLTCSDGFADCNLKPGDGCEIDLTSDPINCNACGAACIFANADGACTAGACNVGTCHPGFDDCNMMADDGCETDLANDPANCAGCGLACPTPANMTATCIAGTCGIGDCQLGYADCDNDQSTGCEIDTLSDVSNCGGCGMVCPALPHATTTCSGGGCAVGTCDSGFDDCDHSIYNGCESELATDKNNCSTCGNKCPAIANGYPACLDGVCGVGGCDPGYADCDNDPSNGCETNLSNDGNNCGACDVKCPDVANGTPVCSGFVCGIGMCTAGFADCFGGSANGCETDLQNDVNHCGTCATVCPIVANGTRACTGGNCGIDACATGYGDCDKQLANGCETTFATDVDNCGMCGNVCPTPDHGTAGCAGGSCTLAACDTGYSDCDHDASNGCEFNTQVDPNNCGGCGIKCGSGVCVSSACQCLKTVLIIPDDSATGTQTLATAIGAAGYTVTIGSVPAYQYNGTNPALTGFGAVVVLAGGPSGQASVTTDMPAAGQTALVNYVKAGNGLVLTEWAAFHVAAGRWQTLKQLVLLQRNVAYSGQVTYTVDQAFATHPVWSGLPSTFTFASTSNVGVTQVAPGVTRIAGSPQAIDAVAILDAPAGRVVHVAHAGNYAPNGWSNATIQKLIANAAGWAARCN